VEAKKPLVKSSTADEEEIYEGGDGAPPDTNEDEPEDIDSIAPKVKNDLT